MKRISHSWLCMITRRILLILLLIQTVNGEEFFNQQQACEEKGGQFIMRNGKVPAKCENAVLGIVTKTDVQARVACVNSFAYGILESHSGDPTTCTYEIVADCPTKYFPMYDVCVHILLGPAIESNHASQECNKLGATIIEMTGNHVPKYLFQAGVEHAKFWVKVSKDSRISKINRRRQTDEIIMQLYPDAMEETKPGHMYVSSRGEKAHVICQKPAIYNVNLFEHLVDQLVDFNQMCQLRQQRIWCVSQNVYKMEEIFSVGHYTKFHPACSDLMKPMKYSSVLEQNTMATLPYRKDHIVREISKLGELEPSTVGEAFGKNILFSPIYRKTPADKSCSIQPTKANEFEVEMTTLVVKANVNEKEFWASGHPKTMCNVMNGAVMSKNKIYEAPFTTREPLVCNTVFDICAFDGNVQEDCHRCVMVNYKVDCRCATDERDVSTIFNKPSGTVCSCGSSKPIHIYFVLDGSASIDPADWTRMIEFVRNFLKSVQYDVTYITMIQFADTNQQRVTDHDLQITNNTNIDDIIARMGGQYRGNTDLAAALKVAHGYMNKSPVTGKKIVVVVTDGQSWYDPIQAANDIRNEHEATILAVGVGREYSAYQVERVAGTRANVYSLSGYKDMNERLLKWIFDTGC